MHLLFLPGAAGAAAFWHPLGALLPPHWEKTYLSWPGLGDQPHEVAVDSFDGLVALAETQLRGPTVIVAQSMGGIVAVRLALKYPERITHLVLTATSGGIDVSGLGGADWRAAYLDTFPASRTWITTDKPDHAADIPALACPTLLIWGDSDPISPLAVGQTLSKLMNDSTLLIVEGGEHDLGKVRAKDIAPAIIDHLEASPCRSR